MAILFLGFAAFSATTQSGMKASMDRGKLVYQKTCLPCHMADGSGAANMNPPLIKTSWVLGDKKQLITVILKGLDEELELEAGYFQNPMPAQAQLTDREIADVLTYVRNSFGNKASQVTEAEVTAVRKKM